MNKKIITGIATLAIMSTSVSMGNTLYGEIRTSVDYMDNGDSYSTTSVQSNSSRIGVKGVEKIGNGYGVGYLFEWGINSADSSNDFTSRNRGLMLNTPGYGTALIGKWDSPMKVIGRKVDLFGDQIGDTRNISTINSMQRGQTQTIDQRWDNIIQYASPNWNGFGLVGAYSTDTNTDGLAGTNIKNSGDNNDNDAVSVTGAYNNGPYYLAVGYEWNNGSGLEKAVTYKTNDQNAWRIAGAYDITNNWKVLASYTDINNAAYVSDLDFNITTAGTSYKMGNNTVKFQYANRGNSNVSATSGDGVNMYTLGVDHDFSVRTTVYATYSMTDNADASKSTPWQSYDENDDAVGAYGKNSNAFSIGLVHRF